MVIISISLIMVQTMNAKHVGCIPLLRMGTSDLFNLTVSWIPAKKHAGMTGCFYIIYDVIPIHLPVIPAFMFMEINLKT
jgi:hypothetical protein